MPTKYTSTRRTSPGKGEERNADFGNISFFRECGGLQIISSSDSNPYSQRLRHPSLPSSTEWTRFEGPKLCGVLDKGKEGTGRIRMDRFSAHLRAQSVAIFSKTLLMLKCTARRARLPTTVDATRFRMGNGDGKLGGECVLKLAVVERGAEHLGLGWGHQRDAVVSENCRNEGNAAYNGMKLANSSRVCAPYSTSGALKTVLKWLHLCAFVEHSQLPMIWRLQPSLTLRPGAVAKTWAAFRISHLRAGGPPTRRAFMNVLTTVREMLPTDQREIRGVSKGKQGTNVAKPHTVEISLVVFALHACKAITALPFHVF
ncbi:hypothetical protein BJV77DRAFT_965370 [Russula vinacea]|nr:hypothetical protein BJV77DRAFT_965370 [Russula vinacea]